MEKKKGYKKIELTPTSTKEGTVESETLMNIPSPYAHYVDSSDSDEIQASFEGYLSNGQRIPNFSIATSTGQRRRRREVELDPELGDLDPNIETNDVIGEIITEPKFYFCMAIMCVITLFCIVFWTIQNDTTTTTRKTNIQ